MKRHKLLKIFLILVLLAAVGLLAYCFGMKAGGDPSSKVQKEIDARVGLLPGMNEQEIEDRLNRNVAESRLNISMNPTPVFADGRSEGDVRIENIQGNKYGFTVTVTVIGTDEEPGAKDFLNKIIMKTGLIDPGKYVENRKLDVNLPKGTYVCVASFTAYDTKTEAEVGTAGMQIVITVKS